MSTMLIIRHTEEQEFQVMRADGKSAKPVELTAPDAVAVEGRPPDSHLLQDLCWYLEKFLDYPFPPNTEVAERIQAALKGWGEESFSQLFTGRALIWYHEARQKGLEHLTVKITSDEPRILGWPWEALRDPEGSTLAHSCRIERQLNELHDPLPLPDKLSLDRINILLVIARPYGDKDVGYHALARPLVELVEAQRLPVRIDMLRPPTFAQLQKQLRQHPGFYHIVHFDGHGGYGEAAYSGSHHSYQGVGGRLIFETQAGEEDPISADKLTTLLSEYRIPIMVLNACQSARIDKHADDPFASVAAALLKAGIRGVVAMSYNLYVSGAQQFVPAFYERLLESGEVAEATRAGRQAMWERDARVCARGEHPLQDWLVPVLYQQDALVLPVDSLQAAPTPEDRLPEEAKELGDYGFIGRQRAIHALDRACLSQPQAAFLVHGMAGVGKSTLAMGYLRWLQQTHGLGSAEERSLFAGILWFGFDDIRSAEFVINRLVEVLFGHEATAAALEKKLPPLIQALRETPLLMVWDNFESAAGIAGTEVMAQLSDADRQQLKGLIKALHGGKSKLLLTSRSPEPWLGVTEAYRLPLGGLQGEERWEYCNAVVADLGLKPERDDADFSALMDELDGHPLAMRAVLLRLGESPAGQLLTEFKEAFTGAEGDESTKRIYAALGLLGAGLPENLAPVLQLIGLHRRYVVIDYLAQIAQGAGAPVARDTLEQCFAALETGGLLHQAGPGVYRMHPALGGFLAERHPAQEASQKSFAEFMALVADQLVPQQLSEQRAAYAIHAASFYRALGLLVALRMDTHASALTRALAVFAQNRRDFSTARQLFELAAQRGEEVGDPRILARAYLQLGIISHEQRDLTNAGSWYEKALTICKEQGYEYGLARSYNQMGNLALDQHDFERAEAWYKKALVIKKDGDQTGTAFTYRQLGVVAQVQQHFESAKAWYEKARAIFEKQGNEQGAAITYQRLGSIALKQSEFRIAEAWYGKALGIFEKQTDEHEVAVCYVSLGVIARKQQDYATAEESYKKALAIFEKQDSQYYSAFSYEEFGSMALEISDLDSSRAWYEKSLEIRKAQGDAREVAHVYYNLGIVAQQKQDSAKARDFFDRALTVFKQLENWYEVASCYQQLGTIAWEHKDFENSKNYFKMALALFDEQGNNHSVARAFGYLGNIAFVQGKFWRHLSWRFKAINRFVKDPEHLGAALGVLAPELTGNGALQADLGNTFIDPPDNR